MNSLQVATKEINDELDIIEFYETILKSCCNDDEHVFKIRQNFKNTLIKLKDLLL